MAAEAFEAVVRVAEVVEATDLNININESCFKRMFQIRFFCERSEPRLSQKNGQEKDLFNSSKEMLVRAKQATFVTFVLTAEQATFVM